MKFFESDSQSYYDILDIPPDATPNDIRQAYFRTKAAYSKDSAAIYSLFDDSETKYVLERIEQAYLVLSNPEKRKEYDKVHGFLGSDQKTEFAPASPSESAQPKSSSQTSSEKSKYDFGGLSPSASTPRSTKAPDLPTDPKLIISRRNEISRVYSKNDATEAEIAAETDFSGAFFKKVREYKNISLDEMCEFTKISKNYLNAIEGEIFTNLPAGAYVRGFVVQVARALKLPPDPAAKGYMNRYNTKSAEKKALPRAGHAES